MLLRIRVDRGSQREFVVLKIRKFPKHNFSLFKESRVYTQFLHQKANKMGDWKNRPAAGIIHTLLRSAIRTSSPNGIGRLVTMLFVAAKAKV